MQCSIHKVSQLKTLRTAITNNQASYGKRDDSKTSNTLLIQHVGERVLWLTEEYLRHPPYLPAYK